MRTRILAVVILVALGLAAAAASIAFRWDANIVALVAGVGIGLPLSYFFQSKIDDKGSKVGDDDEGFWRR